ncbi:MAG: transposase [Nitrospirae bacterium]|nr:transposase [Nitrospirota bacterium]
MRIEYPGAVYYVTCRGNDRRMIFIDDSDRKEFLDKLVRSCNIYNIKTYSFVLMPDHFHLLIETPHGNLGNFMRHFSITYTGYYSRRHNRTGHLYQGRYSSVLVDMKTYLTALSRHTHLNPIRIKGMKRKSIEEKKQRLMDYKWSSLHGYIGKKQTRKFIDYQTVLEEFGGNNDNGRRAYRKRIIADISEPLEVKNKIIGQSLLGKGEFIGFIRSNFLNGQRDKELPSLTKIHKYHAQEKIIETIEKETGWDLNALKTDRGIMRQLAIDLLFRKGGLSGSEIGRMMGIDYSTVSQQRKRLRLKMQNNFNLNHILERLEKNIMGSQFDRIDRH